MKVEAYFDDVRKITLYREGIDLGTLEVYRDQVRLKTILEDIGTKTYIYLDEDVAFTSRYSLIISGHYYPVKWRHVVRSDAFDRFFAFDADKLGPFYTKTATTFRLWAPLCDEVFLHVRGRLYPMNEVANGVLEVKVSGNLEGEAYHFELKRDNTVISVIDPFSLSSGPNASYSVIIDPEKLKREKVRPKEPIARMTDALIYEMSVRDMTSFDQLESKTKGIFNTLREDLSYDGYKCGIPYIKALGFTHVQLMPVWDFGRIDENDPKGYNWGYDPVQYNVPEGTYCSDVSDPLKRVKELCDLIDYIHSFGLYVVSDVVFNHVFEVNSFVLHKILPYYFFRYSDDENLANGSFCGNEVRTEGRMMRAYIVAMVKRYITIYDLDGLRFDLMSLIDIETINTVKKKAQELKPYFIMYGEAWDMPSSLSRDKRCIVDNYRDFKGVAYFDGSFRDALRGNVLGDEYPGYIMGDLSQKEAAASALCNFEVEPSARINFVECHDNATFYDSMKGFHPHETDADDRLRTKLAIAMVILAQGIPFIHSGQEFARTKKGNKNSYNAPDDINTIDYKRRSRYIDIVNFTKDMIKIRKFYPCLRLNDLSDIKDMGKVRFENELLIYDIANLKIVINPTLEDRGYELYGYYLLRYKEDHFAKDLINNQNIVLKHLTLMIFEKV